MNKNRNFVRLAISEYWLYMRVFNVSKSNIGRFKKLLMVGVGFLSGPGILFLIPYIANESDYAGFAKVLAASQLLSLIGTIGLETACPRLKVGFFRAMRYVSVSLLAGSMLVLPWLDNLTGLQILLAIAAGLANSILAIYQSYLVFNGNPVGYGQFGLLRSVVVIMFIMALASLNIKMDLAWVLATIVAVLALYVFNRKKEIIFADEKKVKWRDVFKFGAPLAIVYGSATLPFILDRIIGQEKLQTVDFARYAVAVTWSLPIIYIGNIFQQYLVSNSHSIGWKTLVRSGGAISLAGSVYIITLLILVFNGLKVPYFSSASDFFNAWIFVSSWYVFYSAVAFPMAAVVQRAFENKQVNELALWSVAALFPSLIISWFGAGYHRDVVGIAEAISFSASFAIMLLIPRIFFVCRFLLIK